MTATRSYARELRDLSTSFRTLAKTFDRLALMAAATVASNGTAKASGGERRKLRLSPEWRRALKLHGAYMGTMRGLKPRQRAQVKKSRAATGVKVAIVAAKRMAG